MMQLKKRIEELLAEYSMLSGYCVSSNEQDEYPDRHSNYHRDAHRNGLINSHLLSQRAVNESDC